MAGGILLLRVTIVREYVNEAQRQEAMSTPRSDEKPSATMRVRKRYKKIERRQMKMKRVISDMKRQRSTMKRVISDMKRQSTNMERVDSNK